MNTGSYIRYRLTQERQLAKSTRDREGAIGGSITNGMLVGILSALIEKLKEPSGARVFKRRLKKKRYEVSEKEPKVSTLSTFSFK